ncbi:hypothetical protein MFTT_31840 [Mycolicibacterium fortuitum subsp. fortuitum]|nr:hypothetical protein MFTT_31840 [Mycolicibacterium fortuitum subsp. fortuitum]
MDPVTATLPVVPDTVHSGAPAACGAAVGQVLASVAVSAIEGVSTSATDGVLVEDEAVAVSESAPQAASVMVSVAAHVTSATVEGTRKEFMRARLQPKAGAVAPRLVRRCADVRRIPGNRPSVLMRYLERQRLWPEP